MRRAAETLFLGSYVNKIDAKGRLAAPARFRRVLEIEKSATLYVVPSPEEPCLEAGGSLFVETLMASIEALPPYDRRRKLLQRTIASRIFPVSIDAEGRMILPQHLRDHAGLADRAEFAGQGGHFEIWNPDTLAEVAVDPDEIAQARASLENPPAIGAAP